jgi:MFS family permease
MAVFVAGRAVQGFGAGLVIVAVYVVVAEAYAEDLRPQVFAALSAAWVLPSVLGPAISGLVTARLTWRLVFLGLPPFVVVGALFLLPTLRRLPVRAATRAGAHGRVVLAVAAALGVGALQIAGQHPRWLSAFPAVAGVVLLGVALPRLLPRGTARLAVGLPAVVGLRGLLAGAFFGADAFLPLTLTTVHGFHAETAGIPLTLSALGWSAGSWWQGRRERDDRRSLLRAGFVAVAVAVLGLAVVARPEFSGWVAAPIWVVGGVGMGLAMPTISVLTLKFAPPGEQGFASSALQISDVLGSSICIGFAGVLLTSFSRAGASMPTAIAVINVVLVLIALTGLIAAGRARAGAATLDRQ